MQRLLWTSVISFLVGSTLPAQTRTIAERLGHPAGSKLLILHADDLAVAHSVNAASFDALEKGAISSASVMVPTPWITEVAAWAKAHPNADLGLHLTLTSEWETYRWGSVAPPDKVPSLLDSTGTFPKDERIVAATAKPLEVERELRAQIERAFALGIRPTHLDSHMGALFSTPELIATYVKVAREYRLPFLAVRSGPRAVPQPPLLERDILLDAVVIAGREVARDQWMAFYLKSIAELRPGLTEMIVHLGHDDSELRAVTVDHEPYGSAWRKRDYDVVTSPEFKKALKDNHVILVTWRELQKLVVQPVQPRSTQAPRYSSKVTIYDVAARSATVVHEADVVWEAPNWSRDGKFLLSNSGGKLYRIPVDGASAPELVKLDPSLRCNNDHDFSPDGKLIAISASSPSSPQSQIHVANADGSNHRLVISAVPSYFHGWSPDGRYLSFVANRDGKQYDLYRVPAAGGQEERLTVDPAYDDGSDYSWDGKWIYFNSNRGGGWNIWRIPADGAGPDDRKAQRITNDDLEDWFPHPSPDGKALLFLSFPRGTEGHNERNLRVQLRMIPMPSDALHDVRPKVIVELIGGQGTINVNSWSPDSRRFAYVSYEALPAR